MKLHVIWVLSTLIINIEYRQLRFWDLRIVDNWKINIINQWKRWSFFFVSWYLKEYCFVFNVVVFAIFSFNYLFKNLIYYLMVFNIDIRVQLLAMSMVMVILISWFQQYLETYTFLVEKMGHSSVHFHTVLMGGSWIRYFSLTWTIEVKSRSHWLLWRRLLMATCISLMERQHVLM